jgi:hypothetical protein
MLELNLALDRARHVFAGKLERSAGTGYEKIAVGAGAARGIPRGTGFHGPHSVWKVRHATTHCIALVLSSCPQVYSKWFNELTPYLNWRVMTIQNACSMCTNNTNQIDLSLSDLGAKSTQYDLAHLEPL